MKPVAGRIAALRGEGALSVFGRARELEREGRSIIHLELGEPDFHPSPAVIPGFRCRPPEGAFYAWVNVAGTGLPAEEVCRILLEEAGVAAIPGAAFGASGADFVRFSFASSAATLGEAIARMHRVSAAWR